MKKALDEHVGERDDEGACADCDDNAAECLLGKHDVEGGGAEKD
jgi:hypothetical protein